MKLGAGYNIFNGDELLVDSLKRLRKHADYIVITYQLISNFGEKADHSLLNIIDSLPTDLYDDLILFEPNLNNNPQINETNKRNLGLKYARLNQCSHYFSIDCDEFYEDSQFTNAKNIISEKKYKSTACELVNYFHDSRYRMIENKQYVPFIFKISRLKKISSKENFQYL